MEKDIGVGMYHGIRGVANGRLQASGIGAEDGHIGARKGGESESLVELIVVFLNRCMLYNPTLHDPIELFFLLMGILPLSREFNNEVVEIRQVLGQCRSASRHGNQLLIGPFGCITLTQSQYESD